MRFFRLDGQEKNLLRRKNVKSVLKDKEDQPLKNQRTCVAGRGDPAAKVPREESLGAFEDQRKSNVFEERRGIKKS